MPLFATFVRLGVTFDTPTASDAGEPDHAGSQSFLRTEERGGQSTIRGGSPQEWRLKEFPIHAGGIP